MKAAATFYALDENGRMAVYRQGDDVPSVVAKRVGAHVLDKGKAKADPEPDGDTDENPDGDGQDGGDGEPDGDGDGEDLFDPSAHSAREVKEYLDALDPEDDEDVAEFGRVVEAEKAGKNRSSALPAAD